ncbi:MAG: response regulator [Burkholderiales bacterium]|nr:response regulator [Burkholderiales bacterium]
MPMDLNRSRTLVVDDHPGMLASLSRALEACGIRSPHAVRSAREAVARLRNMRYDIVLADFDLGAGPDGQQLLEYCRNEHLLTPTAVFIMVTAERAYDRVMSAAELAPDDYLVKPFTEEALRLRLVRALERKKALAVIHELRALGRHADLLQACDRLIGAEPRFAFDLARTKGDALIALARYDEAQAVFEQVLQTRAIPWARLGVARALEGLRRYAEARSVLTELLADAPEYLAAYDELSRLHGRCDNDDDAKAVLQMALEVSPNAVHRHKAIGELALRVHDLETAEAAYGAVVRKSRHGFAPNPDDHLTLSRIYMDRSKYPQALDALAEAKRTFPGAAAVQASASAIESLVHSKAESPRDARRALDEALAAAHSAGVALAQDITLDLAQACYMNKREAEGASLVQRLVSNNHEDSRLIEDVRRMYREIDREEQGETLVERCVDNAVSINNEGVARAKNGDLEGAIELLEEAARTMPDNAHIVMNAAHALISHMQIHGLQADKHERVESYLQRVRLRHPEHPKYLQVTELHRQFLQAAQAAA